MNRYSKKYDASQARNIRVRHIPLFTRHNPEEHVTSDEREDTRLILLTSHLKPISIMFRQSSPSQLVVVFVAVATSLFFAGCCHAQQKTLGEIWDESPQKNMPLPPTTVPDEQRYHQHEHSKPVPSHAQKQQQQQQEHEERQYHNEYGGRNIPERNDRGRTIEEMQNHLDCDAIFDQGPRPVHTEDDWNLLRTRYENVVGLARSSLKHNMAVADGFRVAVKTTQAGDKGRGVFLQEAVPAGTLIWSTVKTARFDSGADYRRFLYSVPPDLACDVMQWAYVQSLPGGNKENPRQTEKLYVSVDLDEGSFINSAEDWLDHGDEISPNLGCHEQAAKKDPGGCKENYYALRDIEPGEELLLDYGSFAIQDGWRWFGL